MNLPGILTRLVSADGPRELTILGKFCHDHQIDHSRTRGKGIVNLNGALVLAVFATVASRERRLSLEKAALGEKGTSKGA